MRPSFTWRGRLYAFVSRCWTILHAFSFHECVCPNEPYRISMHACPWRSSTIPCISSHMERVQRLHVPNHGRIWCVWFGSVCKNKKKYRISIEIQYKSCPHGCKYIVKHGKSFDVFDVLISAYNLTKKQTSQNLLNNIPKKYWHTSMHKSSWFCLSLNGLVLLSSFRKTS